MTPAIEMYHYHGQLGLECTELTHCCVVQDQANPDVWSSNKAFAINAGSAGDIEQMVAEVDAVFGDLTYRHFVVDPHRWFCVIR